MSHEYPPPGEQVPGQQPMYPSAPPPPSGQPAWGQGTYGGGFGGVGYGAPYAAWIKRVGSYLVDLAVIVPPYLLVFIGSALSSPYDTTMRAIGWTIITIGLVGTIGVLIWNSIIRQGRTGWSIGKQVIGIRLIGERSGEPIGAGLAFVRMLAHFFDGLCYIGYLWPLWDRKRQTFADKIMGTVVIEQKRD